MFLYVEIQISKYLYLKSIIMEDLLNRSQSIKKSIADIAIDTENIKTFCIEYFSNH
jgi:hypothetical protein